MDVAYNSGRVNRERRPSRCREFPWPSETSALLLVLVLLPWPATADKTQAASKPVRDLSSTAAPLANIGAWLVRLLDKNACLLDLSGICVPGVAPQPANADNGCGLEPDGRCNR
jgi:hypothetical protein